MRLGIDLDRFEFARAAEKILGRQKQFLDRQRRPPLVARNNLLPFFGVLQKARKARRQIALRDQQRLRMRVIKNPRRAVGEKKRQQKLHAFRRRALPQRFGVADIVEAGAEVLREHARAVGVERKLARRNDFQAVGFAERQLRRGAEKANLLDFAIEQNQAKRARRAGGENIDLPAVKRELAGRAHAIDARETGRGEARQQPVHIDGIADRHRKRAPAQKRRRRERKQRRGGGDNRDPGRVFEQFDQRRDSFGDKVGGRRERVVRQRLPIGQKPHRGFRGEKRDLLGQMRRAQNIARHEQNPPAAARRHLRERERFARVD